MSLVDGKCPFCVEAGERSTVNVPMSSTTTLMTASTYYDEDGKLHNHDPNWSSASWSCSRGHRWSVSRRRGCPACGREDDVSINEAIPTEPPVTDLR